MAHSSSSSDPSISSPKLAFKARPKDGWIILILGQLCTISPFSIDMYLPAFSKMALAFQTTVPMISFSVSSYFVGFALGQIFYGPLLDRFGRKPPLYLGLVVYFFATIACLKAANVEQFIVLRFLQALGGCAAQVAAMAMVRDFFGADKAGRVFSLLVLILGSSPLLAPTLGGFMTTAFGWESVFLFLLGIDVVLLAIVFFFLPESYPGGDKGVSLKPKPIILNFLSVIKEPQFYTFAISGALSFSVLFVYVTGSPIIFMENFHVSASVYGLIFAGLSVGFIGGSQANLLLLRKFKERQIFTFALTVQSCVAVVLLVIGTLGFLNFEIILIALAIMFLCLGLINPNGSSLALAVFSRNIGSASALLGFLQIGIGAIASLGVGLLSHGQIMPIIALMGGCAILAFIVFKTGVRRIETLVTGDPSVPAIH